MMKLYYMPGACSLAPHIVAKELNLTMQYEKVGRDKKTETGADYLKISPTGAVPCLQLDNGEVLTEGAVIMQYLCDQVPTQIILPKAGTLPRVRVQEWLNYIASEVHKGLGQFFSLGRLFGESEVPAVAEGLKKALPRKFEHLEKVLKSQKFLVENKFSPADAYLFTVLAWAPAVKVDLSPYPGILSFIENMQQRPTVRAAMQEEGLSVK